ncbi:SGNH/GDSL hydrolase family protein [Elizabethkingia meningoseptica]|uniref:SGNH/GDSL hydrolase family protein n=1 Tax=Elizabethkingia meningoseptica TaxID=238 RepID=UPI00162776AF|nr:SGNH/GDSL hydrolase family protein [Elizabethkingia meningoseptica]HAY3553736.1 SGNH/GDSL hydrolase family protein [Elizabethkingia meningoseptica]
MADTIHYTKVETDARINKVKEIATIGISGVLETTTVVPSTGKYKYEVFTPGNYTNVNPNIEVTPTEIDNEWVYIYVIDGVSQKELSKKPNPKALEWEPKSYDVGSQVFYKLNTYESLEPTLATEIPGTSTKWKLVGGVTDSSIKPQYLSDYDGIEGIIYGTDKLVSLIPVVGKYIDMGNGSILDWATAAYYAEYIPLTGKSVLVGIVITHGGVFYDENKQFISGFGSGSASDKYDVEIQIPIGAKFVRVNAPYNQSNTVKLLDGYGNTDKYYYKNLKINPNQIDSDVQWVKPSALLDYEPFTGSIYGDNKLANISPVMGKYISRDNGVIYDWNNILGYYAEYIPTIGNVMKIGAATTHGGAFYNAAQEFISGFGSGSSSTVEDVEIQIPIGAKFVRINYLEGRNNYLKFKDASGSTDDYSLKNLKVYSNQIVSDSGTGLNQWMGKKVVWLGTSIPFGQGSDVNYPTLVSDKLGFELINTSLPWQALETNKDGGILGGGSSTLSIAEYQALGVSNPGYRSYENSLLGHDADLYVFDCEPNNERPELTDWDNFDLFNWKYNDNSDFRDHRKTYLGALLFMLNELYKENPLARVVFIGEYGFIDNTEYPIRTVNIMAADKMRIAYINVWSKLNYNKFNKSILIPDNVHPSDKGHKIIADILANELLTVR